MKIMPLITGVAVVVIVAAAIPFGYACSGAFDVAADTAHWGMTSKVMTLVRDRSIAVRAAGTTVPNLADLGLIAMGAEHYAEMCTGCHLAPGVSNSELRQGLYPLPPNLSQGTGRDPAEEFWIIKHGIKLTAMPAWGTTHDDDTIWAIVAFVRQLPTLDATAYAALIAPPEDEEDIHEHDHGQKPGHARVDEVRHELAGSHAVGAGQSTIEHSAGTDHQHTHPDGQGRAP